MGDEALLQSWYFWLAFAGILIVAVAALLILVLLAAKRILRLALVALGIVETIKANTASIWGLQQTNEVASTILDDAKNIDSHLSLVSTALHELDNNN
ncbi:MAG: hypothetical protein RJQ09_07950 [Cyclobacteriaceae bacterium]